MSIPVTHTITLKPKVSEDPKAAKFDVVCSCQWQGMAHTRQVADRWVNSHAYAQTLRGNEVIIEIAPELLPPPPDPPVEAGPVESDPIVVKAKEEAKEFIEEHPEVPVVDA